VLAALLLGWLEPVDPARLVVPGLVALGARDALRRARVRDAGRRGLDPLWGSGDGIGSIPIDHYRLVTNPTLPTIPLFTLAGYLLAEGGASKRLMRVFQALFGRCAAGRRSSLRCSARSSPPSPARRA
jgi:hypothetical protein